MNKIKKTKICLVIKKQINFINLLELVEKVKVQLKCIHLYKVLLSNQEIKITLYYKQNLVIMK